MVMPSVRHCHRAQHLGPFRAQSSGVNGHPKQRAIDARRNAHPLFVRPIPSDLVLAGSSRMLLRKLAHQPTAQIVNGNFQRAIVVQTHDLEGKDRMVVDAIAIGRKRRRAHFHIEQQFPSRRVAHQRRRIARHRVERIARIYPLPSALASGAVLQ